MTDYTAIRSNGFTAYPNDPLYSGGKKLKSVFYGKTIATGAGTNKLHILSGAHSFADKVVALKGATPALTSATNNDLGFYRKNEDGTFTALGSGNELWSGADLSSALTYRELLGTVNTSLDRTKNIGQLLSLTGGSQPVGGVYVGLLIKTASTATSEVLNLEVVIEEGTTN